MIDPIKILQRAWHILWNYRALWVFGLILALATGTAGPSSNGGGGNGGNRAPQSGSYQPPTYGNAQDALRAFNQQMHNLFTEGIPAIHVSPQTLIAFLWVIGIFVLFMLLIGIIVSIAYYVSVTSVIRMVDEYENSGTKMTVREGWRIGWSRSAWRVFLINLIVHLPGLLLFATFLAAGIVIFMGVVNGRMTFNAVSIVSMVGLAFLGIFIVVVLSFLLGLLRPFFWRMAVLEDAGVGESLRRGFAMVRENWKSAGIMWLVMIGLGLAWIIVSIILVILTIPVVILTAIIAAAVVILPGLLLVGLFSLFLGGPLPWIAAGLFVLPLFGLIAFSPWLVLGSWKSVYTSAVWTLTYREIKALPATLLPPTDMQPVGD